LKKRLKLKIFTKLILGFGIILFSFLATYIFIYQILKENRELSKKVNNDIVPTMTVLSKYSFIIYESKQLIKNWVVYDTSSNTPKKSRLLMIIQKNYPEIRYELKNLYQNQPEEERLTIEQLFNLSDNYFLGVEEIIKTLNSPEKYNEPEVYDQFVEIINDDSPLMDLSDNIKNQIDEIYLKKKEQLVILNTNLESTFISIVNRIILSGLLILIMVIVIAFLFINSTISPLNKLRRIIVSLSKGELPDKQITISNDEIGEISSALNDLITGLKNKADFAEAIKKGSFTSTFIKSGDNDILGNSLIAMRESLSKASEEEFYRRQENEQRAWITQGITEFNSIIREHSETTEEFAGVTINKLTRYTNSKIGGFYIVNESNYESVFLELIAFYAYERNKFFNSKIYPGQNLIGQCYLEKESIFMTDIPRNYIKVSSGIGKEDPKSILITPLMINEKVYGVIELASINVFEHYQIEFVEKVGEIIASTIASIQINTNTAHLLEESKEKSEILEFKEKENRLILEKLNQEVEEVRSENLMLKNALALLKESDKNVENKEENNLE
jgi:methyl-accepting chemotaxis protein